GHRRRRRRTGTDARALAALFARAPAAGAGATAACRAGSTATDDIGASEIGGSDDWTQNETKDHCVHEQRRYDPFPIPIFPPRHFKPRNPARSYFTSFGVAPITLTPAPRAASIALITSEYFTVGSPLMNMILSGRGS